MGQEESSTLAVEKKIIGLAPRVLYPAHGKPFKTSDLEKYLPFVDRIRLYPLK